MREQNHPFFGPSFHAKMANTPSGQFDGAKKIRFVPRRMAAGDAPWLLGRCFIFRNRHAGGSTYHSMVPQGNHPTELSLSRKLSPHVLGDITAIGGRMGSGDFTFQLSNINFSVSKSQIEIDGGFESERYIYLVEVKNLIHDNFLVRQVYYPYRTWTKKLEEKNIDKKVRNIFLTYSDGTFYLREYEFEHIEDPSSIKMVKEDRYSIVKDALNLEKLQEILDNVVIVEEPDVPFPQCNDLDKVINLCELLCYKNEEMSKAEIVEEFRFVDRQADYYGNGARYLN